MASPIFTGGPHGFSLVRECRNPGREFELQWFARGGGASRVGRVRWRKAPFPDTQAEAAPPGEMAPETLSRKWHSAGTETESHRTPVIDPLKTVDRVLAENFDP